MIIHNSFDYGGFGATLFPVIIVPRMAAKDIHILLIFLNISIYYDTILQTIFKEAQLKSVI